MLCSKLSFPVNKSPQCANGLSMSTRLNFACILRFPRGSLRKISETLVFRTVLRREHVAIDLGAQVGLACIHCLHLIANSTLKRKRNFIQHKNNPRDPGLDNPHAFTHNHRVTHDTSTERNLQRMLGQGLTQHNWKQFARCSTAELP